MIDVLNAAQRVKNDEFYTSYSEIKNYLSNYSYIFENKNVYCNCDSEQSNFWKYFFDNFKSLKLKSLTCTCYANGIQTGKKIYINDGVNIERTKLTGSGSYKSKECIDELKKCDIVCTNPPFSKFIDYINVLYYYKKDFIVIGSNIAFTLKNCFNLYLQNRFYFSKEIGMVFHNGNTIVCRWYSNLKDIYKQKQMDVNVKLDLSDKKNYEFIYDKKLKLKILCVNNINKIPFDYYDYMCVPVRVCDFDYLKYFDFFGLLNNCVDKKNNRKFQRIMLKRKI